MTKQQVLTGQALLGRIKDIEFEIDRVLADIEVSKALGEQNSYGAEHYERLQAQHGKLTKALSAL